VQTPVQDSEWGTPVFIIPKKDGTVCFITDHHKVNKEGFQFTSAFDLNMGYYSIWLTPGAKDLTTVTEFRKFRYEVLPMGMFVLVTYSKPR
jgi:hypothetical protein